MRGRFSNTEVGGRKSEVGIGICRAFVPNAVLIILLSSVLCLPPSVSWGYSFAGGTGEPNDPYQIATAEQLISIGSDPNLLDKHFIQTADIDLDPNLPGGKVFTKNVIGGFSGSFDGNGCSILNMKIDSGDKKRDLVGFFGTIWGNGQACQIHLINPNINAPLSYYVGTLAGSNSGLIYRCSVTKGIISGSRDVGGMVGMNDERMEASFADINVTGIFSTGGLMGTNKGQVSDCYASGHVSGNGSVGGLIGYIFFSTVYRCYSLCHVDVPTGMNLIGGFGGTYLTKGGKPNLSSCYFLALPDGGGPDNGLGTPLTSLQMVQQFNFKGFDFLGTDTDGTEDTWIMPQGRYPILAWQGTEGTDRLCIPDVASRSLEEARTLLESVGLTAGNVHYSCHPTVPAGKIICPGGAIDLFVSWGTSPWQNNPGDGSQANPYQIGTADELESLASCPELWGKCFVLTADIEMEGRVRSKALIAPDTDDSKSGFQGTTFTGSFNGNGHTIYNLTINNPSTKSDSLGMFGWVGQTGQITRLKLDNTRIICGSSSSCIGLLAGSNQGQISGSSAIGLVTRGSLTNMGSLVGCGLSAKP